MWGKLHLTFIFKYCGNWSYGARYFQKILDAVLVPVDGWLAWTLRYHAAGPSWPTGFDFCVQYHFAKEFLSTYVTKCIGNYLTTTATVSKIMRDRETLFTIHYSIYLSLVVPSSPGKNGFGDCSGFDSQQLQPFIPFA